MKINRVTLKAVSMAIPESIELNNGLSEFFEEAEIKKISDTIGIYSRRIAGEGVTALDLMYDAVNKLLDGEGLDIDKIDCLVCICQTPDYIIPGNSFVLCNRLNAGNNIFTLDINAGCSGFTHGMITISKLMENSNMKYGILVTGDTISRLLSPNDKTTRLIFGDGVAACLIEQNERNDGITAAWKTIGRDFDRIMVSAGGMRNPMTTATKVRKLMDDNIYRCENDLIMNGADVYSFTIKEVPEIVSGILNKCSLNVNDIDLFVFHQANRFIVDYIRKKLKISQEKTIIQVDEIGNTSSASIPIALCLEAQARGIKKFRGRFCFAGFGAGLSLSSLIMNIEELSIHI